MCAYLSPWKTMFTHQLLASNIIWNELFTFYNRNFIINFVKSTYNTEFSDNTTFGVKNYLISSLIPYTIYILTQFKVYMLHAIFQI